MRRPRANAGSTRLRSPPSSTPASWWYERPQTWSNTSTCPPCRIPAAVDSACRPLRPRGPVRARSRWSPPCTRRCSALDLVPHIERVSGRWRTRPAASLGRCLPTAALLDHLGSDRRQGEPTVRCRDPAPRSRVMGDRCCSPQWRGVRRRSEGSCRPESRPRVAGGRTARHARGRCPRGAAARAVVLQRPSPTADAARSTRVLGREAAEYQPHLHVWSDCANDLGLTSENGGPPASPARPRSARCTPAARTRGAV